ncbi:hypothetical protein [Micromonospora sp. CA-111912]|uniref:hypothetical protein n=1 Tax=Micromonospora sp. CA-111912 TaxID=3239955 RepID=UPI003D89D1A3
MARKTKSTARQALVLAFAAGAVTGAASMLTLRRRRHDAGMPGQDVHGSLRGDDVAGPLGESAVPPVSARLDAPAHGPVSMSAARHG